MDKNINIAKIVENGTLAAGTGVCAAGATAATLGTTTVVTTTVTTGGSIISSIIQPALCCLPGAIGKASLPILTSTTFVTTPAWAVPVAIAGGAAVLGVGGWKLYKWIRR